MERLLRYSSELKALDRIDVSEDEYLRYQELREKVSRLIREGLKITGSEEVMIKALSLAEEALRKTGKAVLNTSLLDSILGLNTGGSMITVRLSSLVEKCSGKYAELYKRMVEKLEAVYGNIYLVLTPEYSILKRLPGMEEKTVVIEWSLSYKSI
ncbi:MAG: hypothetical protein OWQ48_02115 [Desulfurococcus sp.]|nr:hypothetical protein [Desulfurococcus sp.]